MDGNGRLVKASAVSQPQGHVAAEGCTVDPKWPHQAKVNARHYPLMQPGRGTQRSIFFPLASGVKL